MKLYFSSLTRIQSFNLYLKDNRIQVSLRLLRRQSTNNTLTHRRYQSSQASLAELEPTNNFIMDNNIEPKPDTSREELRAKFESDKSHHMPNGRFRNPWESYKAKSMLEIFKYLLFEGDSGPSKRSVAEGRVPDVVDLSRDVFEYSDKSIPGKIQLTWLGHASMLLQMDGANIIFDPVLSKRCSPLQWIGPMRYTRAPCMPEELPVIHAVVLSHNHYDHLDYNTLMVIAKNNKNTKVFAPLGNRPILESIGFKDITVGDWWQEFRIPLGSRTENFTLACTPAQHVTNRGLSDRFATLWGGWVVIGPSGGRFYFTGDTGYSTVTPNPTPAYCPAFEQIGKVYGPFDLATIPIGAYEPEKIFSSMHVSPEKAVRIHEDIMSRRSIGMHWGTFVLTQEPVDEPPQRLAAEMKMRDHAEDKFTVIKIGETIQADVVLNN